MGVYLRIGRGPVNNNCSLGWVCVYIFFVGGSPQACRVCTGLFHNEIVKQSRAAPGSPRLCGINPDIDGSADRLIKKCSLSWSSVLTTKFILPICEFAAPAPQKVSSVTFGGLKKWFMINSYSHRTYLLMLSLWCRVKLITLIKLKSATYLYYFLKRDLELCQSVHINGTITFYCTYY